MPCLCPSCCPDPDPRYSPEWMRACLVRDIARSREQASFLRLYAKHHGQAEAEKLADEIRAELGRRHANKA